MDISNHNNKGVCSSHGSQLSCKGAQKTALAYILSRPLHQTRSNQTSWMSHYRLAALAAGNTHIVKSGQLTLIPPTGTDRLTDRWTHTQLWAFMCSVLCGGRTATISLQTRGTGCMINVTGHLDMYQHAHVRECTQIYVALHTYFYVSSYMTVGWSRAFFFFSVATSL